jgi:hypothetical protein
MDTGPAVQGRIIDLYMWSCKEALAFGRKQVEVEVLRLGWNPNASTPALIDRIFRRPARRPAPVPEQIPPATTPSGTGEESDAELPAEGGTELTGAAEPAAPAIEGVPLPQPSAAAAPTGP